jgi:hypothetical protein
MCVLSLLGRESCSGAPFLSGAWSHLLPPLPLSPSTPLFLATRSRIHLPSFESVISWPDMNHNACEDQTQLCTGALRGGVPSRARSGRASVNTPR